jgi:hypothetical protein
VDWLVWRGLEAAPGAELVAVVPSVPPYMGGPPPASAEDRQGSFEQVGGLRPLRSVTQGLQRAAGLLTTTHPAPACRVLRRRSWRTAWRRASRTGC